MLAEFPVKMQGVSRVFVCLLVGCLVGWLVASSISHQDARFVSGTFLRQFWILPHRQITLAFSHSHSALATDEADLAPAL